MRFTEHELTAALSGTAKAILARQNKDVRKKRTDIDAVWNEMDRYQRFQILDKLGGQLLPVLVALPDVAVAAGTRAGFSDQEITEVVAGQLSDDGAGKLKRAVVVKARVALVKTALAHMPPRVDPDALLNATD